MPPDNRAKKPLVSVILASHNRAAMLAQSAGSVLAQSHRDLELIVVDDGSDEDIAATVKTLDDARVRYLRRNECGGPAAARNSGLALARGRFIAFQDDDDEWLHDKLALQLQALRGEGDNVMCVCGLARLTGRLRPYPGSAWPPWLEFSDVAAVPRAYTQTWLVPRAALLAEGGFDERLWLWEDWELLLRLATRLRIRTLSRTLALSVQSRDSISHDNKGFLQAMTLVLEKHEPRLARHPKLLAGLLCVQARLFIGDGQLGAARRILRRAVVLDRGMRQAWQLWAISFLGKAFVMRRFRDAAGLRDVN